MRLHLAPASEPSVGLPPPRRVTSIGAGTDPSRTDAYNHGLLLWGARVALYQLDDDKPAVDASAWVADSADVIGRVQIGADSSVWFGAVLRGDSDDLRIGVGSNVQDACVLHADAGFPLRVGDGVTIGHQVMLHGCTIGDGALIGIQSVILNGARIGANCLVGAGSLVPEGREFPPGQLILGRPAKVVRALTEAELERLAWSARHYAQTARRFRLGLTRLPDVDPASP